MPELSVERPKHHLVKIWLLICAVVVALLAAVYFFIIPTPSSAAQTAADLNLKSKFTQSLVVINSARLRTFSNADKIILYSSLAATNAGKGDLKTALYYYKKVEALNPDDLYGVAASAANVAEQAGDKVEAIRQYELALELLKKRPAQKIQQDSPLYYQLKIQELKK
jgi:tetratricopeptide (TPR) repeat protein